jgi:hypothetical protein
VLRDERGHILRLIAAAAATVRRLRERLAGGGAAPDDIVRESRAAQGELLGTHAALLGALDPTSAATLLADPPRVAAWAELLRVEAAALRTAGRAADADAMERRAEALARTAGTAPTV